MGVVGVKDNGRRAVHCMALSTSDWIRCISLILLSLLVHILLLKFPRIRLRKAWLEHALMRDDTKIGERKG
jgi:hypothetical protein